MRNGLLLGVGNTNNITTAITMSYGEPNWAIIPSAGRCKKTKEQLVFEIKDLANRVANAKEGIEKEQLNREVLKLHADYLSDVSPDRIGLYQQAEKVIKSQNKDNKGIPHGIGELTLLYFLKHADKSQNLADKSFPLAETSTLSNLFVILLPSESEKEIW